MPSDRRPRGGFDAGRRSIHIKLSSRVSEAELTTYNLLNAINGRFLTLSLGAAAVSRTSVLEFPTVSTYTTNMEVFSSTQHADYLS